VHHPHLHCVVPGGGLSLEGDRWIACRPGFFLPVRVLARFFRRVFLEQLDAAFHAARLSLAGSLEPLRDPSAWTRYLAPLRQQEWVVFAKRPFAGPQQVLDYVGRYTHRVAISNDRLCEIDDGHVRFTYKDYRADPASSIKTMTLAATEFIRRFLWHVLPLGFHRIRYYGFLGPRRRHTHLARCRHLLATQPAETPAPGSVADERHRAVAPAHTPSPICPVCRAGHMRRLAPVPRAVHAVFVLDSS